MAPRIPVSPANAPMRGTSDACPPESSACAAARASGSASRSSSSSTSLRVSTSISGVTVLRDVLMPRRLSHEDVELAGAADDAEAVRLGDAPRALVPAEDRHPQPRLRGRRDDVREDGADELAPAPLSRQVGPHPVADVNRSGLLLDAGHARLRSDAGVAHEIACVVL